MSVDSLEAPVSDDALIAACIDEVCETLLAHEAELSEFDRAIGDGDHGSNVARAARALIAERYMLAALPLGEAIEKAGMTVAMNVGGASGPLYGSLLMEMGRAWAEPRSAGTIAQAFAAGVAAVARRGKSTTGEKTMLDVLVPAERALRDAGSEQAWAEMLAACDKGVESTRPMRANKGRAAYVGDRSVGHLDPGAVSARLAIRAAARALGHDGASRSGDAQ